MIRLAYFRVICGLVDVDGSWSGDYVESITSLVESPIVTRALAREELMQSTWYLN